MKNLITFTAILLFSFSGMSQTQIANDLEIFSENGEKFTLFINGEKINSTPLTRVKILNTHHDNVELKIVFENSNIPDIMRKNLSINYLGTNDHSHPVTSVFKINLKNGKPKLKSISRSDKKIQTNNTVLHSDH